MGKSGGWERRWLGLGTFLARRPVLTPLCTGSQLPGGLLPGRPAEGSGTAGRCVSPQPGLVLTVAVQGLGPGGPVWHLPCSASQPHACPEPPGGTSSRPGRRLLQGWAGSASLHVRGCRHALCFPLPPAPGSPFPLQKQGRGRRRRPSRAQEGRISRPWRAALRRGPPAAGAEPSGPGPCCLLAGQWGRPEARRVRGAAVERGLGEASSPIRPWERPGVGEERHIPRLPWFLLAQSCPPPPPTLPSAQGDRRPEGLEKVKRHALGTGAKPCGWHAPALSWRRLSRGWGIRAGG